MAEIRCVYQGAHHVTPASWEENQFVHGEDSNLIFSPEPFSFQSSPTTRSCGSVLPSSEDPTPTQTLITLPSDTTRTGRMVHAIFLCVTSRDRLRATGNTFTILSFRSGPTCLQRRSSLHQDGLSRRVVPVLLQAARCHRLQATRQS